MTTLSTYADALAAGYVPARGWHHDYRGFRLWARDTSGGNSMGYRYSLVAHHCEDYLSELAGRFGDSESVWMSAERNRVHTLGAFSAMFSAATIAAARAEMVAAVDAWYALHPEAAAAELDRQRRADEDAAARVARGARHARRYAEKLASKYGAENLSPRHRAALEG